MTMKGKLPITSLRTWHDSFWPIDERINALLDAIEKEARNELRKNSRRLNEDDEFEVAVIRDYLRSYFDFVASAVSERVDVHGDLMLLVLGAYKAGALGLGSDYAEMHPLAPKRVGRVKQSTEGGKARGKAMAKQKEQWRAEAMQNIERIMAEKPAIGKTALYKRAFDETTHPSKPGEKRFADVLREEVNEKFFPKKTGPSTKIQGNQPG